VLRNIYFAFIYPHILYGIEIYRNTCLTYLDKLTKINNNLLRILKNRGPSVPCVLLYSTYNTLSPSKLHTCQILCLVYKFLYYKQLLPAVFTNYSTLNSTFHLHITRNKHLLHLSPINTSHGHRSIPFKGSLLWNNLPVYLHQIPTFNLFKNRLKSHLLSGDK